MGSGLDRRRAGDRPPLPWPQPTRPYQLQAAINAVHADAPTLQQTDWLQIVALYDQLLVVAPTPVVALNRAIAIGEVQALRCAGAGGPAGWTATHLPRHPC